MRLILAAAASLLASPALAQPGTAAATPARESGYGVTTGSAMSSPSRAPTGGSPLSTAHLPAPGARAQRARSGRTVGSTYGGAPATAGATDTNAPAPR